MPLTGGAAAILHGLPMWPDLLDRVHVIRPRIGGGRRGRLVHVHLAPLGEGDVVALDGDFAWAEHRTVVEFDGKIKYGRLLCPGETGGDVIFREKVGEDLLRDPGWEVVRWV